MSPEAVIISTASSLIGLLVSIVGYFGTRTLKLVERDIEKLEKSLEKMVAVNEAQNQKLDHIAEVFGAEIKSVWRELGGVTIKVERLVDRVDRSERDLNAVTQKWSARIEALEKAGRQ